MMTIKEQKVILLVKIVLILMNNYFTIFNFIYFLFTFNLLIKLAPGPGQYQAFSEFGIYKSKYADKFEEELNKKTTEK
jgi:hypothetical protein